LKSNYLKDSHWYAAFLFAVIFWFLFDRFVQEASLGNVFNSLNVILFSVLLYPIMEEIVFRGLIQTKLLSFTHFGDKFIGITGANLLTSLLFSLAHLFQHSPQNALLVFIPSIIFGYFRDRHGVITASIILHVFYNAGFYMLFVL